MLKITSQFSPKFTLIHRRRVDDNSLLLAELILDLVFDTSQLVRA